MNSDRIRQSENTASSSQKRDASLPDFAAGKLQEGPLKRQKITSEVKDSEKIQNKVISNDNDNKIPLIPDKRNTNLCYKNILKLISIMYEKVKDNLGKGTAKTIENILSQQSEPKSKDVYDLSTLSEVLDELQEIKQKKETNQINKIFMRTRDRFSIYLQLVSSCVYSS